MADNNAMKYFSTKHTIKMMDMRFIPSVCYKLDETIAPTIEKLVEAGEAKTYPEKVRFVNGVAIPFKKPEMQGAKGDKISFEHTGGNSSGKKKVSSGRKDFE